MSKVSTVSRNSVGDIYYDDDKHEYVARLYANHGESALVRINAEHADGFARALRTLADDIVAHHDQLIGWGEQKEGSK